MINFLRRHMYLTLLEEMYVCGLRLFREEKEKVMRDSSGTVSLKPLYNIWGDLTILAVEYNCAKYWWQRQLKIPRFYLTHQMLYWLEKHDPEFATNAQIRTLFPGGKTFA